MIRTVGQLRDAIADYPDYRPVVAETLPFTVAVADEELFVNGDLFADESVGYGVVDLADIDIEEHTFEISHVSLEGGPTVVLKAAEGEFTTILIDPEWVDRQCDEAAAWAVHEIRERLAVAPTHRPCCSSHHRDMTCAEYRRTHFVEVGPCCAIWTALNGDHR